MRQVIEEVRSGGQNGADLAGVAAAKVCGILTGGWMPKGWETLDGPRPSYGPYFGMKEYTEKPGYPPRTRLNVRDSDGTIRFAADFNSPGEKCTLKAIREFRRPYIDIPTSMSSFLASAWIEEWVFKEKIARINVAGNTTRTAPGIEAFVYEAMTAAFFRCGYTTCNLGLHVYCRERFGIAGK